MRAIRSLIRTTIHGRDWLALTGGLFVVFAFAAAGLLVASILSSIAQSPSRVSLSGEWREAGNPAEDADEIVASFHRPESPDRSQSANSSARTLYVRLNIPHQFQGTERTIEFRLYRPDKVRLWIVSNETGDTVAVPEHAIRVDKGGFSIDLGLARSNSTLYGEIQSVFPWKPKIFLWSKSAYIASTFSFERQGGALIGSLLILAIFSGIVAILNRDLMFLLFSGWLLCSIRIAAINGGWDKTWLGLELDAAIYLASLRVSMVIYGFLTIAIFRSLLITASATRFSRIYFGAIQSSFLVLLACLPLLSHTTFLKSFWLLSALSLSSTVVHLAVSMFVAPSRITGWYLGAWATMIGGMISEIGFQAGVNQIPVWLNSQSGAIVSALMIGIALADKLKTERDARLRAQENSLKYLRKYEQHYNGLPVGLFSASAEGNITLGNPAFESMFARESGFSTSGRHIDELLGPNTFERIRAVVSEVDQDLDILTSADGHSNRWFLLRFASRDDGLEGSIQDITARKLAEDQLLYLVDHDHLTRLLNRRGLEASLGSAIESTRSGKPNAVAYIVLDRFKLINDLYGHGTGDSLLQQAAQRIQSAVRSQDLVARVADAFVVVFIDCPDHAVSLLAERLREMIGGSPFEVDAKALAITASVGVVPIEGSMSALDAMTAADRACSEAKARGRNCVVRLTEQDQTLKLHLEELKVVADLQQRTLTDRYFLEFQPIVALRAPMSSLSYEVLIRMRDDDGRALPPGRFIGAAERNGMMSQIDRWVLRSTLEWLDTHPDHSAQVSFATINISGASLNDTRFVDDAFGMIADYPHAMSKLCFEITEGVALHDLASTRRFVDRVRLYGSKLALDDFGAGYTSFNYLKEIPADFIKIDGCFVKDINRNPANYAITRTIVELTHELGMRSIAEWAETPDTIASLYDLGVDYGQGFGLARPMAPELVSMASSGGALVKDPLVVSLLIERGCATASPVIRTMSRSPSY